VNLLPAEQRNHTEPRHRAAAAAPNWTASPMPYGARIQYRRFRPGLRFSRRWFAEGLRPSLDGRRT